MYTLIISRQKQSPARHLRKRNPVGGPSGGAFVHTSIIAILKAHLMIWMPGFLNRKTEIRTLYEKMEHKDKLRRHCLNLTVKSGREPGLLTESALFYQIYRGFI